MSRESIVTLIHYENMKKSSVILLYFTMFFMLNIGGTVVVIDDWNFGIQGMSELQALLLCSGSGSRMTLICNSVIKCLLPVADVPMFWYPLKTLVSSGVKDIKLFVREDGEPEVSRLLMTPLFSFPSANIEVICVSRENEDWGTADLLRHYASKISRDFIVMSCDFISDCQLQPMVDQFRAHKAAFSCLLSDMCIKGPVPGPKRHIVPREHPSELEMFKGDRHFLLGGIDQN
ncbi:hypothetical protein DICVIV_11826 [Dictyocaulus viviparus]|uniref:Translation initiation factor eIF2B subunit gamma n=1 Tax=Dictyocaulus viviparus TaxID=29172 RepID=A0A0D8XIR6_DICVI|nr:hypothetical protein DICVIV_11826 [Dictyocaulus viviparus]